MDLWHGPLSDFVRNATSRALAPAMAAQWIAYHNDSPKTPEVRSWNNSLDALGEALRPLQELDLGVILRGDMAPVTGDMGLRGAPGVMLEYHLPLSGKRIDVLLTGRDAVGVPTALVLELKQWSKVDLEDDLATNVVMQGAEHAHPSEQAQAYARYLLSYHEAFSQGAIQAASAAYCHNLSPGSAGALRDPRFEPLLQRSPLFCGGEEDALRDTVVHFVGGGDGLTVLEKLSSGRFMPSQQVINSLHDVLEGNREWVLLDEQREAYNAVLDEIRRSHRHEGHSVVIVRGAPGTGKTVIAVQLLASCLQRKWSAAHATGGKAFTTVMRSTFKGADDLFIWNMHVRNAAYKGLDLLLVDEAHRVRETSDVRWTPKLERAQRSQTRELIDAANVTVFLLDENQFVRPDEVGSTATILEEARAVGARVKQFDLSAQFRCGGSTEYVDWVDWLLGFRDARPAPWGDRFDLHLVHDPRDLDAYMAEAAEDGHTARLIAGFCWPWSDPKPDDSLALDVEIGTWRRPWNRKASTKKRYKPADHPYTLWATTDEGLGQLGCIYSAQGFEFDRVGLIWGHDLVRRDGSWVAQKAHSHDRMVRGAKEMQRLVRNAYRVLMTRGIKGARLLILDDETRDFVQRALHGMR